MKLFAARKKKDQPREPQAFLAAFGKHPGWDDHIDDQGLDTELLVALRRVLYLEGIGGNIDAGTWEQLHESQRVEGFKHVFVWRMAEHVIVGRMWSSRDGKGRTRYPMVVCAQCTDLSYEWVLREVLPRLESVEQRCVAATSAAEVVGIVNDARQEVRGLLWGARPAAAPAGSREALVKLAERPEMGENHEGLLRVLYQVEREVGSYAREAIDTSRWGGRAHQIRVPKCGDGPTDVAMLWIGALLVRLDPSAPMLLMIPLDEPWVDVIVGEPTTTSLFCIRAGTASLPLTTEIPYTLEPEFVRRAEELIGLAPLAPAEAAPAKAPAPAAAKAPSPPAPPEPVVAAPAPPKPVVREPAPPKPVVKEPAPPEPVVAAPAPPKPEVKQPPPPSPRAPAPVPAAKKKIAKPVIGLLALAAVAAAVIVAVVYYPGRGGNGGKPNGGQQPAVQFDAKPWQALCDEHQAWFEAFRKDLASRRDRWSADAYLREATDALAEAGQAGVRLDPRKIASAPSADVSDLKRNPPEAVKTKDAMGETARALQTVRKIRQTLTFEAWDSLRNVADWAEECKRRGWSKPAAYLDSLVKQVGEAKQAPPRDICQRVDRLLAAEKQRIPIGKKWQEIAPRADKLAKSGSKVLARFSEFAQARAAGAADIKSLGKALDEASALAAKLVAFVDGDWKAGKVDKAVFAKEYEAKAASGTPSKETFDRWLAATGDFHFLAGKAKDWKSALERVRGKLDLLKKLDAGAARKHEAALNAIGAEVAKAKKVSRIQKNKQAIEKADGRIKADLAAGEKGIQQAVAKALGDAGAWLRVVTKETVSKSAPVNEEWFTRLKLLLGQATAEQLNKDATRYMKLMEDVAALRKFMKSLEDPQALPAGLVGLKLPRGVPAKTVGKEVATKRDEALKTAIKAVSYQQKVPRPNPAFTGKRDSAYKAYRQWRDGLARMLADFSRIEQALDLCYLPDEKLPQVAKTPAELYDACRKQEAWENDPIRRALGPLVQRIKDLTKVAGTSKRSDLVKLAAGKSEPPVVLRTAWHGLRRVKPAWPADGKELAQELAIRKGLKAAYAAVKDKARNAALVAEVDGAGLAPWAQFNVLLDGLHEALGRLKKPQAIARAVHGFVKDVQKLPRVSARAEVKALLTGLAGIEMAGRRGDLSAAGPAQPPSPWKAQVLQDGKAIRYTIAIDNKQPPLTFVRIDATGGASRTFYLCTTEVSRGLFLDFSAARHKGQEIKELLDKACERAKDPTGRRGPRVWDVGRDRLLKSRRWLHPVFGERFPLKLQGKEVSYPHGYHAPGIKLDSPADPHPMQYVSPDAAMYFASLMKCRLPTSAEWKAAYIAHEKGKPPRGRNLRDKTWDRQKRHVAALRDGKPPVFLNWPDEDIFWPESLVKEGKAGAAAECHAGLDDGVLWLAAVGADTGRLVHHLVGNVSELVFDGDAGDLAKLDFPAGVRKFVSKSAGKLGVIGGSALSPPALAVDKAYPVNLDAARRGYSDVGFRLAFTAPEESVESQVKRVLKDKGKPLPGPK